MMSRQGLTLLGLGGGHSPITHIRQVLCMRTPLDRTQPLITVHRSFRHTIPTRCCRSSSNTSNSNSNRRPRSRLTRHSKLRKRTGHIQTVQWRLHSHNRSLRHRRRAIHLCHRRQVRICRVSRSRFDAKSRKNLALFVFAVFVRWSNECSQRRNEAKNL